MQRVNGHPVFYLGWSIGVLIEHLQKPDASFAMLAPTALAVAQHLEVLAGASEIVSLPHSQAAAGQLAIYIRNLFSEETLRDRSAEVVGPTEKSVITNNIFRLDNLLSAELGHCPLYFISAKRAWDMNQLIFRAELVLSEKVIASLDQSCVQEIREAGRCIAFDLPTASGFHMFRAIESVVLRYFPSLGLAVPTGSDRNLGHYIKLLREKGVDEKIVGMLQHLKDMYRNPLMHPELTLEPEEAENLFQFGASALSAMADDLSRRGAPTA